MSGLKDIVTEFGAIAGFAALVGMAVLAMLYFSQARDVKRLREWAGRAPERDAEVEQLAQQIAAQAVAEAYEHVSPSTSAVAEPQPQQWPAADETVVAAPAGEPPASEPAAGESTEWIPPEAVPGTEGAEIAAAAPAGAAVPADGEAIDAAEPGEQAGDTADGEPEPASEPAPEIAPEIVAEPEAEPALPAAGAASVPAAIVSQPTQEISLADLDVDDYDATDADVRPSRLAPSTPAAARSAEAPGTGAAPPLPPLTDYQHAVAESIGTGTFEAVVPQRERFRDEPHRRTGGRRPIYIAGALVAIFAVLLAYTQISGDSSSNKRHSAKPPAAANAKVGTSGGVRINRAAVNVSVLNGTPIAGLAGTIGAQVTQAGYNLVIAGNAGDGQNHIQSVVFYAPGSKPEAQDVARELSIKAVKPIDPAFTTAGKDAPVIVLAGADRQQ